MQVTTGWLPTLQILIKTPSIRAEAHSLSGAVLFGNVDQEVADTPRVAPLVIVPGDQLDKVLVQLNAGLGIEDGGRRVADEICRDDLLLGILDDPFVLALGSSLDGGLDFIIRSLLLEANDEVNDRDIEGGDTEGKAAVDPRFSRSEDTR